MFTDKTRDLVSYAKRTYVSILFREPINFNQKQQIHHKFTRDPTACFSLDYVIGFS